LNTFAKQFNLCIYNFKEDVKEYAKKNKLNLEEAGRTLRYLKALEISKKFNYNKIATAHNLNDLISSFFINFIKSNHYINLFNLNPTFNFENIVLIRPLLFIPKQEIVKTLENNNIGYIIDKTNLSSKYLRNYINLNFTNNFINTLLNKTTVLKNYLFLKNTIDFIQNYKNSISNLSNIKHLLNIFFIEFKGITDDFLILESLFFNIKKILLNFYSNLKTLNIKYNNLRLLVNDKNCYKINIIKDWFLIKEEENKKTNKIFILYKSNFSFYLKIDLSEFNENYIEISNLVIKINVVKKIFDLEKFLKENIESLKEKLRDKNYCFGFCFDNIVIRSWKNGDYFIPYGLKGKKQKLKKFFINNKFKEYEKNRTFIFEDEAGIFLVFNYLNNIKRGRELLNNAKFLKILKEKKEINLIEIYITKNLT